VSIPGGIFQSQRNIAHIVGVASTLKTLNVIAGMALRGVDVRAPPGGSKE